MLWKQLRSPVTLAFLTILLIVDVFTLPRDSAAGEFFHGPQFVTHCRSTPYIRFDRQPEGSLVFLPLDKRVADPGPLSRRYVVWYENHESWKSFWRPPSSTVNIDLAFYEHSTLTQPTQWTPDEVARIRAAVVSWMVSQNLLPAPGPDTGYPWSWSDVHPSDVARLPAADIKRTKILWPNVALNTLSILNVSLLFASAASVTTQLVRRRRSGRNVCTRCQYDLSGQPDALLRVCPECGEPQPTHPAA